MFKQHYKLIMAFKQPLRHNINGYFFIGQQMHEFIFQKKSNIATLVINTPRTKQANVARYVKSRVGTKCKDVQKPLDFD